MTKYAPRILERPSTVKEAVSLLKEWGPSARLVAGNTTIYELAREGALGDVQCLIDVMQLGLNYIRSDYSRLQIGATTTFLEMATSPILSQSDFYVLKETAGKITPPQIRNTGTIAGSICSGIPFYDMPVALLALSAKVKAASSNGERAIKIEEFFVDYFLTALTPEEIVVEVEVTQEPGAGTSFVKLGRVSTDFAVVNAAASIQLESDRQRILSARVALGSIASTPVRAKETEAILEGEKISKSVVLRAASEAMKIDPTPSIHASSDYKRRVIPILVRDALLAAIVRAGGRITS